MARLWWLDCPVAVDPGHSRGRTHENVWLGGETGYVGEHRPRRIHRQPEQQHIADGEIIEAHRDAGIAAKASQHVADHDRLANASVIQRLDSEVIASADESPAFSVPYTEREVAKEVRGAVGTQHS